MDGLEDCLLVGLCGSAIGRVGAAPANASRAEGMSATSVTFRKVILISIRTAQLDSQASTTRTSKNQGKQQFSTPKVVQKLDDLRCAVVNVRSQVFSIDLKRSQQMRSQR